ncbi:MAG: hypothetical protein OCD76_02065 [Reichenbachiella sp.]
MPNYLANSQALISMGSWRTHFNYEKAFLIETSGDKMFATSSNGLTIFDTEDNSLSNLSKVDGLSDSKISALTYIGETNQMLLGYESGNIDLVTSEGISNYRVLIDSDVVDNKAIGHISFYAGNFNLSTDFGVLVFEPETGSIRDSYRNLGENGETTPVYESVILDDKIYLATNTGVLMGDLASGDNLQDFNNWIRFVGSPVYNQNIRSIAKLGGSIYALSSGLIYKLDGNVWDSIVYNPDENFIRLRSSEQELIVVSNHALDLLNGIGELTNIMESEDQFPNDAIYDENGNLWYADIENGMSTWTNNEPQRYVLPGPLSDNSNNLKFDSDQLVVFPFLDENNGQGYGFFDEGRWGESTPADLLGIDNISGVLTMGPQKYISSFGDGILDSTNQVIIDETNSPLTRVDGNVLVTGLASDDESNLWISNFSSLPLIKMDELGNFSSYNFLLNETDYPRSIQINSLNQIWMSIGYEDGKGVLAFDGGTEEYRVINKSNSSLPSNEVNGMAFALDGSIWFATDRGVAYFPYSYGVITDINVDVLIPILDNNYLFLNERVNAIEIDGGNRKWMATADGAWLFDENLTEMIYHFDTDNSPLPSDNILDIAVNIESGEVFFATDVGMVSFRSASSTATSKFSNVAIFPNPVLNNFRGMVGIDGLAFNATLRITTISGRLVKALNGSGGSAAWDVTDYTGQRVETGVYLVFSASEDGSETYVGKIAVID